MSPQQLINIDQSVRVLKFLWGTLQLEPGGVTTSYFTQTQASITASTGVSTGPLHTSGISQN